MGRWETGFPQVFHAVHSSAPVPVDGILFPENRIPIFLYTVLGIRLMFQSFVLSHVSQTADKVHHFTEFHQKAVFYYI